MAPYISSLLRRLLRRERATHSSVLDFEYDSTEKLALGTLIGLFLHCDYAQIVADVLICIRARKAAFYPLVYVEVEGEWEIKKLPARATVCHRLSSTSPRPPISLGMRAFVVNQYAHPSKIPVFVLLHPQN